MGLVGWVRISGRIYGLYSLVVWLSWLGCSWALPSSSRCLMEAWDFAMGLTRRRIFVEGVLVSNLLDYLEGEEC